MYDLVWANIICAVFIFVINEFYNNHNSNTTNNISDLV